MSFHDMQNTALANSSPKRGQNTEIAPRLELLQGGSGKLLLDDMPFISDAYGAEADEDEWEKTDI